MANILSFVLGVACLAAPARGQEVRWDDGTGQDRPLSGLLERLSSSEDAIPSVAGSPAGEGAPSAIPDNAVFFLPLAGPSLSLSSGRGAPGGKGGAEPELINEKGEGPRPRVTPEQGGELLRTFSGLYPNVSYEIDAANNGVNAVAWVDGEGRRHVQIWGGMLGALRSVSGLALIAAHETGHHYGGAPRFPGTQLSCEAEADFFGGGRGMRAFGATDESMREAVNDVIENVLGRRREGGDGHDDHDHPDGEPGGRARGAEQPRAGAVSCGHPPAACRRQIYEAAWARRPMPECAGPRTEER